MSIEYKEIHDFSEQDLKDLFLSVEWSSGHFPDKLVRPEYQGKGIGKVLVDKVHEKYRDYLRIVVVAYNEELAFYEHCGFKKAEDASPMFITSLWT